MKLKIKKWGNSLAIRIPRAFAMETNLHDDSVVEFFSRDNELVIVPMNGNGFSLEDLLEGVNDGNLHAEITTGAPAGAEIW
jgi:antitoxin MazE